VTTLIGLVLLLAPEAPDEVGALEKVFVQALSRISPSVVTIETVGGVRRVEVPAELKERMTLPERPREGDDKAPPGDGGGEGGGNETPEGQTPRFKDEWRKMLALPGFQKAEGPTTGVILTADGYVVTSAWNFEGEPNVVVVTTADRKTHAARLLGIDRAAGLALLKADLEGTPAAFLDPAQAREGAWALAVGRVLSRDVDVKYGIVSAKNRIEGNALQTDAATSPSNYGGPLIDVEGRVYGIIVPLGARGEEANPNWYDSGIGFATPIPDPAALVARLGKEGVELFPAFLGVSIDQDRTEPGALVTEVVPEQAAAKAGVEKGDVILRIDGTAVDNAFSLRFAIGRRRAEDRVKLEVLRGEETLHLDATLGRRQPEEIGDEKLPIPMPGPQGKPPEEPKRKG
jgi:serine protease Do